MKYQKPTLSFLNDATVVIQGVNTNNGKVNNPHSDAALPSSSINSYGAEE